MFFQAHLYSQCYQSSDTTFLKWTLNYGNDFFGEYILLSENI